MAENCEPLELVASHVAYAIDSLSKAREVAKRHHMPCDAMLYAVIDDLQDRLLSDRMRAWLRDRGASDYDFELVLRTRN